VSLLEVLIATFVLSIGLLGVAAVIPVGRFVMVEAAKADRAAACGRSILHDIKVRSMINPDSWRDVVTGRNVGALNPYITGTYVNERRGFLLGESYAIDSYFAAGSKGRGATPQHINDFPYNVRNLGTPIAPWGRLQRVTCDPVRGTNQALARAIYMWQDDLLFTVPKDDTQRTEQFLVRDAAQNAIKGDNAGNYTWFLTVSPAAEHVDFVNDAGAAPDNQPYCYAENTPLYSVSVVVCHKRDLTPPNQYTGANLEEAPGERQVRLTFLSGGLGGGDVLLSNLALDEPPQYLDVKENEWLMVSGFYPYYYEMTNGTPAQRLIGVHKWYRIVSAPDTVVEDRDGDGTLDAGEDANGNGVLDPPYRYVTLAGPDWNPSWTNDWDRDGTPDVFATLVKGVIGVYTTTVEFDW